MNFIFYIGHLPVSSFPYIVIAGKGMKIGKWEILYTLLQTEGGWKNVLPMQKVMTKRSLAIKLLHSG